MLQPYFLRYQCITRIIWENKNDYLDNSLSNAPHMYTTALSISLEIQCWLLACVNTKNSGTNFCEGWVIREQHCLLFQILQNPYQQEKGELVNSKIAGPMKTQSSRGAIFNYVIFKEDSTGLKVTEFLNRKSEEFGRLCSLSFSPF